MAQAIKDTADAIDKLTSFENLYLLVTLAEVATGKEIVPGTPNDVYVLIDFIREFVEKSETSTGVLWDILAALPTAFGGLVD